MNPNLARLQSYPFEKLADLTRDIRPAVEVGFIALSIGEPKHPTPSIIRDALLAHLHDLAGYPTTHGLPALREAIVDWLNRRYKLPAHSLDPNRHVLAVNGSREGLFAFAQAALDPTDEPLVLMPNPFYQIYEGAALLAGGTPHFLPCTAATGFVPDFDAVPDAIWDRCRLLYICSPSNPTGAVLDKPTLSRLIERAHRHDFILAADECYAEIYLDEEDPPPGLLQVAAEQGLDDYSRCIVFHSLSKRSNAPGLRSGFVAGDAALIEPFYRYRTYHGCAMPLQHQHASIAAWGDESHVIENRSLYRAKFDAVLPILDGVLDVQRPAAGFYLWPRTDMSDTELARGLLAAQRVKVLPGSFLSRPMADGSDPGAGYLRLALVAPLDECVDAAHRIREYVANR
jgi:N-succinyldiaminopimelate aminotransferase